MKEDRTRVKKEREIQTGSYDYIINFTLNSKYIKSTILKSLQFSKSTDRFKSRSTRSCTCCRIMRVRHTCISLSFTWCNRKRVIIIRKSCKIIIYTIGKRAQSQKSRKTINFTSSFANHLANAFSALIVKAAETGIATSICATIATNIESEIDLEPKRSHGHGFSNRRGTIFAHRFIRFYTSKASPAATVRAFVYL